MKKAILAGAFLLLCAGCVTGLSQSGARVRVGKMPPHSNCRELGLIYGSGGGDSLTTSEDKLRSAQNQLRNKTAAMGGNFVVLDASGGDIHSITLSGRAFKCGKAQPPDEVSAPAPKTHKTPEERLKTLKGLLDKGLITQEEYDKRRQEILQSI